MKTFFKNLISKDQVLGLITVGLFAVGIGSVTWVVLKNWSSTRKLEKLGNLECVRQHMTQKFSDPHMEGAIPKDATFKIYENFYQCNPISRGDMVLFRFSAHIRSVPRFVRGLPGDKFSLESTDKGKWSLTVNGEKILGPDGQPYLIQSEHEPPLKTYEKTRSGVLADDEYILLSHNPPGMSDSGNLGVIKKGQISAKLVPIE